MILPEYITAIDSDTRVILKALHNVSPVTPYYMNVTTLSLDFGQFHIWYFYYEQLICILIISTYKQNNLDMAFIKSLMKEAQPRPYMSEMFR